MLMSLEGKINSGDSHEIQKIQGENNGTNKVIYFGDGLTDRYAFEYVHSIGGKNVFIISNNKSVDIC